MSTANMQTHLRAYYAAQTLRPEVMASLLAEEAAGADGSAPVTALRHPVSAGWQEWVRPMAAAAAIWVVLTGVLQLWGAPSRSGGAQDIGPVVATAIAQEIARNHHARADIEFPAATFAELRGRMDRLDFTLIEPVLVRERGFRLMGGRYCSVQGQVAAQIKVADPRGEVHTLYETRLSEGFAATPETTIEVDGVQVMLWHEVGLLVGLAGPRE